jgi:hypothetical protein
MIPKTLGRHDLQIALMVRYKLWNSMIHEMITVGFKLMHG